MSVNTITKITVPTPILQELVAKAVKGSTMVEFIPLSHLMKLSVKDNVLKVETTDNVNFVTVMANVNAPDFEIVVNSKLFSSLISKISTPNTSITLDGTKVIIEANGTYNLSLVVDADGSNISFPPVKFVGDGTSCHISGEELRSILTLNKSCKSEEKAVPCLYNYYMDDKQVITTDTFKACINPIQMFKTPVMLSPTVVELIGVVMDESGVDIQQSKDSVMFSSTKGELFGKKISQTDLEAFPAEDIINNLSITQMTHSVNFNKTMLLQALDRIGLFIDAYQQNKLNVTFTSSCVMFHSDITDSRESVNYLEKLTDTFEPVSFNIDALYLKNEVTACLKETVTIKFNAEIGLFIKCDDAIMALGLLDEGKPLE